MTARTLRFRPLRGSGLARIGADALGRLAVSKLGRRLGLAPRWLNHRLDRVESRLDVLSA
ncbi:hypothetical protein [Magnetospirillum fulvum]|uniref:Uncharacterized protein n=1 Tax=Magnetospirillum fulvum TaxID=1082 RepID=A0A1H6J2J3_MAGFU|nr:hypothetical protein [Magnetospirillum fulvum]SEH56249.1 hypothetical protein SAMN04244559_02955 [Magnetospirillum fulvum]